VEGFTLEKNMKTSLGMGMAMALALMTMGCGKASCDDAISAVVDCGMDMGCMEKTAKKYAHCAD
jgi:hypothetical protein